MASPLFQDYQKIEALAGRENNTMNGSVISGGQG
jgi:hypothetical protein